MVVVYIWYFLTASKTQSTNILAFPPKDSEWKPCHSLVGKTPTMLMFFIFFSPGKLINTSSFFSSRQVKTR